VGVRDPGNGIKSGRQNMTGQQPDPVVLSLVSGLLGALFGGVIASIGTWVAMRLVQSRDFGRRGQNAARAIFAGIYTNSALIHVALLTKESQPHPLQRTAYDSLVADLAGWLSTREMLIVSNAYTATTLNMSILGAGRRLSADDLGKLERSVGDVDRAGLLLQKAISRREAVELDQHVTSAAENDPNLAALRAAFHAGPAESSSTAPGRGARSRRTGRRR
jgi:hypothetical protein